MNLEEKVVMIIGAGRGIGRAAADIKNRLIVFDNHCANRHAQIKNSESKVQSPKSKVIFVF